MVQIQQEKEWVLTKNVEKKTEQFFLDIQKI